jgi:hypothetical protein
MTTATTTRLIADPTEKAFNAKVDRERTDAARLSMVRWQALRMLSHWTRESEEESDQ